MGTFLNQRQGGVDDIANGVLAGKFKLHMRRIWQRAKDEKNVYVLWSTPLQVLLKHSYIPPTHIHHISNEM